MFNKLLDIREDYEMTQTQIANKIGVSRSVVSKWENGNEVIPLKHLNSLCNFYNVSMDYILKLSKNKTYNKLKNIEILDKKLIGQRIKEIRNNNNLTLRDLAKILNTTSSTISAYETGKTLILTAFAYQICKKYKVSLDWLCGKSER